MADVKGISSEKVTAWMKDAIPDMSPPLTFDAIQAGRSNLTFGVSDQAGRKWVLRRPPTGHVLQSAHDMGREFKIIGALQDTDVPVPGVVGLCEDTSVNDAPFYVMQFVEGTIIRDRGSDRGFTPEQRRKISEGLVRTLTKLHAVDPDAVGLGDLAKREDYIARQLHRWMGQVEKGSDRDLPRLREVHKQLEEKIPAQRTSGIVHGDYRLDNCMISSDGEIAAVLDWELCTLGDVMADIGTLVMYWGRWADFISSDEATKRYGDISGRDISELPYYVAFAFWRLACILEGVRVRFEAGAMGDKDSREVAFYGQLVDSRVESAAKALADL